MRSDETVRRGLARSVDLIRDFSNYVEVFENARIFTGPSTYFHKATLERRKEFSAPESLLADTRFLEYLYATLTAWGMHRMGPGGAKLIDFSGFKASLQTIATDVDRLWSTSLLEVDEREFDELVGSLWSVLERFKIAEGEIRLVANSKALHHILPNAVPPVDRRYTLAFFFGSEAGSVQLKYSDEEDDFEWICQFFRTIGREAASQIEEYMSASLIHPFRTSPLKIIDNAIIGFGKSRLSIET